MKKKAVRWWCSLRALSLIHISTPSLGQDYFKGEIGTPNHTLSWFGRANYPYKGKYLLTATFRADGSSKFAPSHQWGCSPAPAAASRISDEAFMENTRDWLDNLKLRVSYATSGSDNIDAVSYTYLACIRAAYGFLPVLLMIIVGNLPP